MKTCTKCGESKPTSEYTKHKMGKDGLRPRCKACMAVESAAYREANREAIRAHGREMGPAWREKHRDRISATFKRWSAENKDRRQEWTQEWRANNPWIVRFDSIKSRAVKGGALPEHLAYVTMQHVKDRLAFYDNKCLYCGIVTWGLDHRIPLSRGGPHLPANLVPCCQRCNAKKQRKTEREFKEVSLSRHG